MAIDLPNARSVLQKGKKTRGDKRRGEEMRGEERRDRYIGEVKKERR